MRYMIDWSTSKLSDSRTYTKREDDGRSRRSDAWNNGSKGVSEIESKLFNNISFLALTGAQETLMSLQMFVRFKFV